MVVEAEEGAAVVAAVVVAGAEERAPQAPVTRMERVPLGLILRTSLERPWLQLYRERPHRGLCSLMGEPEPEDESSESSLALSVGDEVWLNISTLVGSFLDLGRLAQTCSMLQRVTSHSSLWEPKCVRAWKLRGFVPCEEVLYAYGWSWRRMVRALI
ncbi:hypothetical protein T492DRAFT_939967 [Pavlovales sp. CCMP2436]|nr:hypothetical protein T492DRAFT_939967 [Pavlovales sp. CCMP2436]